MANVQPTSFAALLKRYRTAAGLTQEQLAARARLSPETIAALERGKRRAPRASTVELLADALALSEAERAALLAARLPSTPVATPGGAAESQPLPAPWRTPQQPTPLIDREGELAAICRYLVSDGARLLTLAGPAGVGKTRLALAAAAQLADHFPDGVTRVDLAPLRDPRLVLPTVAQAFGLPDLGDISALDRLRDYLRERRLLAVMDNFDRVLPAAADLAELLAACPELALLVTSRAPLGLRWEHLMRVAPLDVPDPDAPLPPLEVFARIPAVALFVERAQARRADFTLTPERAPLVARLVAQLDGLPLALELAAARLDTLPLRTIVERLEDRLRLLRWEAADLPERQRSLEAAIGWSYDLLPEAERRLFRHLGVFLGQVALDAIYTVQEGGVDGGRGSNAERTLEGLVSLAEKSFILPPREDDEADDQADDQAVSAMGGPAFVMLETTREYAWEQLEAQRELAHDQAAHAGYFLALAERAAPALRRPGQRAWYLRLERERDNLRAALRWQLDQDDPAARVAALRMATALGYFWRRRGYLPEGARWLEEALAALAPAARADSADGADKGTLVRARALIEWGEILTQQGELTRARSVLDEALTLAQEEQDGAATAAALFALGERAAFARDEAESARLLHDALSHWQDVGGHPHEVGMTLFFLGIVASTRGADEEAAKLTVRALGQLAATGDERLAAIGRLRLAMLEHRLGEPARAVAQVRIALDVSVKFHDRWLLGACARVALVLVGEHADFMWCARLLGGADARGQASGDPLGVWERLVEDPDTAKLRALVAQDECADEYQKGRSLSFEETAHLARSLLVDAMQTPGGAETSRTARPRSGTGTLPPSAS